MAYAFTHPKSVRAMVLRGVCLFRKKEIDWLFGNPPSSSVVTPRTGGSKTSNLRDLIAGGSSSVSLTALERQSVAAQLFTEEWKEFSSDIEHDENNKRSVLHSYYHRLLGTDTNSRYKAMRSWFRWEMGIYGNGFKKSEGSNEDENRLLIWDPSISSWLFEDARVHNHDSIDSIHMEENSSSNYEIFLQSLRRLSPSSSSYTSSETDRKTFAPLAIEDITGANAPDQGYTKGSGTSFDPTTYVPAQAMLTCYYSVNDDYCIHPYNSFLSLNPPPSVPLSSWFSSELPPSSSSKSYESSVSSGRPFPLPPAIAIQGGNDAICPADTALDLHNAWQQLEIRIALKSGHSMYDPVIAGEIVKALERFGRSLMTEDRGGSDDGYGR